MVTWLAMGSAWALQLQLRVEPPTLSPGQAGLVTLELVFERSNDVEPLSYRAPVIPTGPGLSAEFAGSGTEFGNTRGRISRVLRFRYRLTAVEEGTWTVGPVDLPLSDGTIAHTEPVRVVVTDQTDTKAEGPLPENEVQVSFDDNTLWEGQVVVLKADFRSRFRSARVRWRTPDWNGLQVVEQGNYFTNSYTQFDPDLGMVAVHQLRLPLMAVATGVFDQSPLLAEVTIPPGLFDMTPPRVQQLTAKPLQVQVQPLPPPPPGFSGVVGDVQVRSNVDASHKVAVGQSVEWTIEVSGAATLNAFDLPQYSADHSLVYDKGVERTEEMRADAYVGTAVFRRVLVPTEVGQLTLPTVEFVTFSPSTGQYVTHTVELPVLDVVPGADLTTKLERYGSTTAGAGQEELVPAVNVVRPPYLWGRASAPSLAPVLPALLGLAAAPGLAVLARLGAGRAAEELARRRAPRSVDPGRASSLLAEVGPATPDDARWGAFDAVLRRFEVSPSELGTAARADTLRALRMRLGRARFGGRPDPTFEQDLRAFVSEVEG